MPVLNNGNTPFQRRFLVRLAAAAPFAATLPGLAVQAAAGVSSTTADVRAFTVGAVVGAGVLITDFVMGQRHKAHNPLEGQGRYSSDPRISGQYTDDGTPINPPPKRSAQEHRPEGQVVINAQHYGDTTYNVQGDTSSAPDESDERWKSRFRGVGY